MQHSGLQKPVKNYYCLSDISCLDDGDKLKDAEIFFIF